MAAKKVKREISKGNESIALGALHAGLDAYFGYPITPSSEIPETLAKHYKKELPVFLQAESEIAAINMVYGASSCGARVMTATSGPGYALKLEGISYIACSEMPCVIVNIMRGGPGLGNIGGEQADYFSLTKGGGHGGYRIPSLAPNSVQEMYDFTIKAFDIADKFRTPVFLVADGYLGQMKEGITVSKPKIKKYDKSKWATTGAKGRDPNITVSIYIDHDDMEKYKIYLKKKYDKMEKALVMVEEYKVKDADYVFVAFGLASRIVKDVIIKARENGLKVGLIRPKTLWPFPYKTITKVSEKVKGIITVEMNQGQMVEDVRLAVEGRCPVEFYGRCGGNLPTAKDIYAKLEDVVKKLGKGEIKKSKAKKAPAKKVKKPAKKATKKAVAKKAPKKASKKAVKKPAKKTAKKPAKKTGGKKRR